MTTDIQTRSARRKSKKNQSGRRPDLQGMRAVAVLAVFADHLFAWPRGGFVGVDIFFVLSGFFITGILIRERDSTGKISFRDFYVRRVRRIIPSAMLVLAVTVIASYLLLPAARAKSTLVDSLWAALFASNWRFESIGTDYFQQGQPPSPLQHYWSLSIEEQFYFVWPLLIVGIYFVTRQTARRGNTGARPAAMAAVMGAICVASFAWATMQSSTNPTGAYFSTFTRVWELGVGALLAICATTISHVPDAIRPALSYLGFVGVVASLFLISSSSQFPGPWAALPVLSTALVIVAFQGATVRGVPHLTNRVAGYFGDISYTLYLWHWPVIILTAALLPEEVPYYVIVIALALALSAATYHLYEDRIRKSRWLESDTVIQRRGQKLFTVPASTWPTVGFILVAVMAASIMAIQLKDRESRSGELYETLVVAESAQDRATKIDPCFGAPALNNPECSTSKNAPLQPSVSNFAQDTQGGFACWRSKGGPINPCSYGSTQPDAIRIALVGDSHAAMLLPALADVLTENNWNLTVYLGDGCRWQANLTGDCGAEIEKVQNIFLDGDPYSLIVTGASRKYGRTADAAQNFADQWSAVTARGTKVLAVADSPSVNADTISCLTRRGSNADTCETGRDEALQNADLVLAAAALAPGVAVADMTDSYCTSDACPAVIGRVIVYRDAEAHVTATYIKSLAPQLADHVREALTS